MVNISLKDKDILQELFNICFAKAADSLAIMGKDRVMITVPELDILTDQRAILDFATLDHSETLVQTEIKGDLSGQAIFLFSPIQKRTLKKVALQQKIKSNGVNMEDSMLLEISNILAGSFVTHLADILKLNIYGAVPKFAVFPVNTYIDQFILDPLLSRSILIKINTSFIQKNENVNLPLFLIFDLRNLEFILDKIRRRNKLFSR